MVTLYPKIRDNKQFTVFSPCFSPSGQEKIYDVVMETIDQDLPAFIGNIFSYATNPGVIMPAVLLMV